MTYFQKEIVGFLFLLTTHKVIELIFKVQTFAKANRYRRSKSDNDPKESVLRWNNHELLRQTNCKHFHWLFQTVSGSHNLSDTSKEELLDSKPQVGILLKVMTSLFESSKASIDGQRMIKKYLGWRLDGWYRCLGVGTYQKRGSNSKNKRRKLSTRWTICYPL